METRHDYALSDPFAAKMREQSQYSTLSLRQPAWIAARPDTGFTASVAPEACHPATMMLNIMIPHTDTHSHISIYAHNDIHVYVGRLVPLIMMTTLEPRPWQQWPLRPPRHSEQAAPGAMSSVGAFSMDCLEIQLIND